MFTRTLGPQFQKPGLKVATNLYPLHQSDGRSPAASLAYGGEDQVLAKFKRHASRPLFHRTNKVCELCDFRRAGLSW